MLAPQKPHRVVWLMPEVTIEGTDAVFEAEAALLVWITCIELCQRHSGLAVYDAEATPLLAAEGHFLPRHAAVGATPTDGVFLPTRRDEVVWLELTLPKLPVVRLHTLARDGKRSSFDATGRHLGQQIDLVLTTWLAARGLGALPKPFEAVTGDELIAATRIVGPILTELARSWSRPVAGRSHQRARDGITEPDDDVIEAAAQARPRIARALASRLPATMKLSSLRVLELALGEDLHDLILAIDPDRPQSLSTSAATAPQFPTELEAVAAAGIAAMCQPANLEVLEATADRLCDSGLVDAGVRFVERALTTHPQDSRAHLAVLKVDQETEREGARLVRAQRSRHEHGCSIDPLLPRYRDQLQIDLHVADALLSVGRLDEAIALRANVLDGRESAWPVDSRVLDTWRKDPRFVAWCYAREGHFRGDPARVIEGFGRVDPDNDVDVAMFLDALVAMGRENEVVLAWAQFGHGRGNLGPVARLAAARALLAAGEWRPGLEELWRVELTAPGRDEHVAIARCGLLLSGAPIEVAEAALEERLERGATSLARRMARDIADFCPGAVSSAIVARALGKPRVTEFDPGSLAGFAPDTRSREAIDALFSDLAAGRSTPDRRAKRPTNVIEVADPFVRADRLVNRWLEVVFTEASADDPAAVVQASSYVAAQALGRYLAGTTQSPGPISGALRTVAGEALALVRRHCNVLGDREVRAMLGAIDPLLRRVDRWIGRAWLGTVERSCGIDERAMGDVRGFARDHATVAARVIGPEESAVLAASVARLHRERRDGWAGAVMVQAARLATRTGALGADEWADAIVTQLAAREIEFDDAIDALQTACYLAEGVSAGPCVQAARVLLEAGRAPAALELLSAGLGPAGQAWRDRQILTLSDLRATAKLDLPLAVENAASSMFRALQSGDPARAEQLGRWAVALDPTGAELHRNLGLALAQQGKVADALEHLVHGTGAQATQILSGALYQSGRLPDAIRVLDYASRWYVRADQWLTYAAIAESSLDNARAATCYASAYRLDPSAFDITQLHAYAGVLDEIGDDRSYEEIANAMILAAGDDLVWKAHGQNHLARATGQAGSRRSLVSRPVDSREPIFALLETEEFSAASALVSDASWRVRRAALAATRFRSTSDNDVDVPSRARAAATAVLADTVGSMNREAVMCRVLALQIREQAYFARDPLPPLGDRMTRAEFRHEFRARGGIVLGEDPVPLPEGPPGNNSLALAADPSRLASLLVGPVPTGTSPPRASPSGRLDHDDRAIYSRAGPQFKDRVVVPGSKVARVSDYVALLRDLGALVPREALAQFDLDDAGYLEVAKAWAAAIEVDPTIAQAIDAGLTKR